MEEEKKYVALPIEFVNTLAGYLSERPFREVVGFIQGIANKGVPVDVPQKENKE